jgi:hypothetical protein
LANWQLAGVVDDFRRDYYQTLPGKTLFDANRLHTN